MNVMQRPLFRASGGEVFPDLSGDGKVTQKDILMGRGVIPRGMEEGGLAALMPAPEAAMMEEGMVDPAMMEGGPLNPAEAEFAGDLVGATQEGEQMGLGYLAQTMDGIDNASNTEELINSIRGTSQPLEARVQELATFVGEEDAMRTPESVLTMVQPVIMMTDEGAIDTGIGELMQGVMGDTEMSADMGQGVGALMAQGQPAPEMAPQMPPMAPPPQMPPMAPPPQMAQAPMAPPQQFAAGGPVVHMAEAGDPAKKQLALQAYFDEYLPVYENLIGSSNEDREKDRALALAKAGFQFASGRDAKGQNIAGSGFLANLASAGAGFTDDIGAIDREQRKLAQGTKTLALQSAFSTDQAKRAAEASLAEKRYDRQTKLLEQQLKNQGKSQIGRFVIEQVGQDINEIPQYGILNTNTGETYTVTADSLGPLMAKLQSSEDAVGGASLPATALPTKEKAQVRTIFDNINQMAPAVSSGLRLFNQGTLSETDQANLSNITETYFAPSVDREGYQVAKPLSLVNARQIIAAVDREENPLSLSAELISKARYKVDNPTATAIDRFKETLDAAERGEINLGIIPGSEQEKIDMGEAFAGIRSSLSAFSGRSLEQVEELFKTKPTLGTEEGEAVFDSFQDTLKVQSYATALADETVKALQSEQGQRPLATITKLIIGEVDKIRPGMAKTRREALRTAKSIKKKLNQGLIANMKLLENRSLYSPQDIGFAQGTALDATLLINEYNYLINGLEASLGEVTDEGPDATQDASGLSYEERVAAVRRAFGGEE